ncbi:unnamed protein product [Staurois parvus]|uniref:Uncharacterized protein n=1 Tax=Staurois parvus TaxID=386267 RepID=A0ABN9CRV2_9NEOB|nr:unnamed protein product [Staurois parvus]
MVIYEGLNFVEPGQISEEVYCRLKCIKHIILSYLCLAMASRELTAI